MVIGISLKKFFLQDGDTLYWHTLYSCSAIITFLNIHEVSSVAFYSAGREKRSECEKRTVKLRKACMRLELGI